ncbi:hypothetical protein [Phenylobacterium sp.]|uniref:hypothetical protein n=1 Tax=Phenylobacterium sp. TaxID=1871053 RepID=UPI002FCA8490
MAATKALRSITAGHALVCRRKGKSYDGIVARCWNGNRDVASEIVRRGQAIDLPKFSRRLYATERDDDVCQPRRAAAQRQ